MIIRAADPHSIFYDSTARAAMVKYCQKRGLECVVNGTYDKIDVCARNLQTGEIVGLELTNNSCWTTQERYPEPRIHIPRRKWETFFHQVYNHPAATIRKTDRAYLVVMNVPCRERV